VKKFKSIAIYSVSSIVLLLIGSAIGSSGAQTTLNGKKMDAETLEKQINQLKTELNDLKEKNKEAFDIVANKDKAKTELDKLQKELASTKSQLDNANSQLADKQKELAVLSGQIQEAKSAPKTLQAGFYVVGSDIPAGRYKATPIGSGSNFIVYDGEMPVVNTILGNDGLGVPSYTFDCKDGEKIQTEAPVQLTPLQ
jgi:exonuclease VII large subunit